MPPDRPADLASGVLALAEAERRCRGRRAARRCAAGAGRRALRRRRSGARRRRHPGPDAVQEALVALRGAVWGARHAAPVALAEALDQLSAPPGRDRPRPRLDVDVDAAAAAAMEDDLAPAVATVAAYRFVQSGGHRATRP